MLFRGEAPVTDRSKWSDRGSRESESLPISESDKKTGDAIAVLLRELAGTEVSPRSLVREGVRWLAHKLNVFSEAFAQLAGDAAGKAVVFGTAGAIGSPHLVDAVVKVAGLVR